MGEDEQEVRYILPTKRAPVFSEMGAFLCIVVSEPFNHIGVHSMIMGLIRTLVKLAKPKDSECPVLDLIESLVIMSASIGDLYPTTCEAELLIVHASPKDISEEDRSRLAILGFDADEENDRFTSVRFGSRGY